MAVCVRGPAQLFMYGGLSGRTYWICKGKNVDSQLELVFEGIPDRVLENRIGVEDVREGWSYQWEGTRTGGRYRFSSQVGRVGGVDGERRRLELTEVVRELLHWAEQKSHVDGVTEQKT